jgi:hypothetical protein
MARLDYHRDRCRLPRILANIHLVGGYFRPFRSQRALRRKHSGRETPPISGLLLVLFLWITIPAQAGPVHVWQLNEITAAPVLMVGEIVSVQKGKPIPGSSFWCSSESWAMTADVRVLRSYTAAWKPFPFDRIRLHFLACCKTPIVSGPGFPKLEPGQVHVLPLRDNRNPAAQPWELLPDEGMDLTIPSRAEMGYIGTPLTARAFLLREIANSLSFGTPEEVTATGRYLSGQRENLTAEIMPLLQPTIGDDRQRWAEIATSILATTGIPRPSVADLLSGKVDPEKLQWQASLFIAQAALRKLGASGETVDLLIQTLIEDAPVHVWGSATALLEYADNPVAIEMLRRGLKNDLTGSSYIAWTFARNGQKALVQEALVRALKVADRPDADRTDLQGATALLRDYGSDQQLHQLASLVRKYQTGDRKFYNLLWQFSTEDGNPREVWVLAVVLQDQHIVSGETRVCDFAVSVAEQATGQHFGAGGKTLAERDAALSRALSWLRLHGIPE